MLLALNVGNTTIGAGLFQGKRFYADWYLATRKEATPDELGMTLVHFIDAAEVEVGAIEGIIISSVVPPLNWTLSVASQRYFGCEALYLDAGWGLLPLNVREPERVGADRIADCLAGYHIYGGPLIIVDFGTATTFNLISSQGTFEGGAIAPTMELASETLIEHSAQLYRIELVPPPRVVGKDTTEHLQAGIVLGFLDLVSGLVRRFRRELGEPARVIATGGRGEFFTHQVESIEIYDPTLALQGLRIAWEQRWDAQGKER